MPLSERTLDILRKLRDGHTLLENELELALTVLGMDPKNHGAGKWSAEFEGGEREYFGVTMGVLVSRGAGYIGHALTRESIMDARDVDVRRQRAYINAMIESELEYSKPKAEPEAKTMLQLLNALHDYDVLTYAERMRALDHLGLHQRPKTGGGIYFYFSKKRLRYSTDGHYRYRAYYLPNDGEVYLDDSISPPCDTEAWLFAYEVHIRQHIARIEDAAETSPGTTTETETTTTNENTDMSDKPNALATLFANATVQMASEGFKEAGKLTAATDLSDVAVAGLRKYIISRNPVAEALLDTPAGAILLDLLAPVLVHIAAEHGLFGASGPFVALGSEKALTGNAHKHMKAITAEVAELLSEFAPAIANIKDISKAFTPEDEAPSDEA